MIAVFIPLLLLGSSLVQGCFRSSLFYRSKVRTRSHVFAPGEYQPRHWEHTVDGSGPLDSRDFQHNVPNKHLLRVDSPLITFASEEARYMTEGCRDRLIKLAIQIQNTWTKQNFRLHVVRGWIKPPPNFKPTHMFPGDRANRMDPSDEEASLRYDSRERKQNRIPTRNNNPNPTHGFRFRDNFHPLFGDRTSQMFYHGVHNRVRPESGPPLSKSEPVVDIPPEMMTDDFTPHQNYGDVFKPIIPDYMNPYVSLSTKSVARHNPFWTPWRSTAQWPRTRDRFRDNGLSGSQLNQMHVRNQRVKREEPSDAKTFNESFSKNPRLVKRTLMGLNFYPTNHNRQPVSTMSQSNFQQWLEVRMEEFHFAGRAVDFQLVSSVDSSNNIPFNLGVLAQLAYYVAQFDWCYYNQAGHVHCSVKPDSSITSQWFGCFPGNASVKASNGSAIHMKDLKIGDQIETVSKYDGNLISTTVVAFMHRETSKILPMRTVHYQFVMNSSLGAATASRDYQISLTPNHLIYVKDRKSPERLAVFASQLRAGDVVFSWNTAANHLREVVVLNVSLQEENSYEFNGIYAPLTDTGTMLVDGVFVSCFAQFRNEDVSWLASWPVRLFYWISTWCDLPHLSINELEGVHWYMNILYRAASSIFPSTLFYQQS